MEGAGKVFSNISKEQLKLIGIILYWGEGSKAKTGTVSLANSDTAIIKVMMKFLKEVCGVLD